MGHLRSSAVKPHMLVLAVVVWAGFVSVALAAAALTRADYGNALAKSILFYDLQRSGKLPSWQRLSWRGNSGMKDGLSSNGVDLTGGYYDAGDNMKFGFPMAFSMTLLGWSVVEFYHELTMNGQIGNTLNALRWGTDYLLKANTANNVLWVQVGDPNSDHYCWERPEDMTTPRPSFQINAAHPGSDVAAETAAALAAASIAFRGYDAVYSKRLLSSAIKLFNFANSFRGKYSDQIASYVCPFYCSYSGYNDELLWGAAWLLKATGNSWYYQYLINNQYNLQGTTTYMNSLNWDNKYLGVQALLAQVVVSGSYLGLQGYKNVADNMICTVLPKDISPTSSVEHTAGGLLYFSGSSNLQYVTTTTLLLTTYAKKLSAAKKSINCGGRTVTASQIYGYAKQQVDYILGQNPKGMSYLVGFGRNPTHVHHRASSMPSIKAYPSTIQCQQGYTYYNSNNPNPNQPTGAILGGPDQNDNIDDSRGNYAQMEPTTYINAPFVGVLAALAAGRTYN